MPTIPAGYGEGIWVFDMTGDPDPYIVTMGFKANDAVDAGDFVTAMVTAWQDNIKDLQTSAIHHRECRALFNDGGTMYDLEHTGGGQAGSESGGFIPQNSALLVRKNTGLAGRKHRGRFYWPGILAEGSVDNVGNVDPTSLSTLQTAFSAFFSDLASAVTAAFPVILHNSADAPDPVVSFTVQPVIATQRRRLR